MTVEHERTSWKTPWNNKEHERFPGNTPEHGHDDPKMKLQKTPKLRKRGMTMKRKKTKKNATARRRDGDAVSPVVFDRKQWEKQQK